MKFLSLFAITMGVLLIPGMGLAQNTPDEFTDQFPIADCQFKTTGGNPYFILQNNRVLHYDNQQCVDDGECDEFEQLWITVLPQTRMITFELDGEWITVNTRVIEELEMVDFAFAEQSLNFFAECQGTGDVYYFGEEVDVAGDPTNPGQWLAGVNGALPGIIFPGGAFLLGARYFQEIAPNDEALDRAEHVEVGEEISVPAGDFENCVKVEETTPLDKKELSEKTYCYGVGLVVDEDLELVSINP